MSDSFLQAPEVLCGEEVASQVNTVTNGSVSKLLALMRLLYRTLTSHRHSPITSLPTELLLKVVSHFTMAQFLSFRGVCRCHHQIVGASEQKIACQLLKTPEFWLAGRLYGNTGPEFESYKHLFGLKRRCSVVATLAKFLSEYSLKQYGEDERFVETDIRSRLLLLTHYIEHHRSSLKAFVSDPNNTPFFGVPNEEIEVLTLANYNYESAYYLCGLHGWLMGLLEKRLEGETLTILDEAPEANYAELLVLGGMEAIKDSIVPDTFTERYSKMEMHMQRACSVSQIQDTGYLRLPEPPTRTVDLALVLDPITPPLYHQTAIKMCGILPKDYDLLEELIVCLPDKPSMLWKIDTRDAVSDFKLEVCPHYRSVDSQRSPLNDGDSGWLDNMLYLRNTRLTRVQ